MSVIVILIALSAGLFVGSRIEGAHDAHQHYSSYKARTNALSCYREAAPSSSAGPALSLEFRIYRNGGTDVAVPQDRLWRTQHLTSYMTTRLKAITGKSPDSLNSAGNVPRS
jgi:hypothetical protein